MGMDLRKQQMVMLDALKEIDRICKKYDIKYSLYAGTALGAIRHKGFIPWDDDSDVVMPRKDYIKFLSVAEKELGSKYFLQSEFSEHWPVFYTKLRVNNTACIERYNPKDKKMHQGIFVDIFPSDNLSDSAIIGRLQFVASKVVIAKCLDRRGYLTDSIFKKVFMFVCKLLPLKFFLKLTKLEGREDTKMVHIFFAGAPIYKKSIFPREWLEGGCDKLFEGELFPVSIHYDEMLTAIYGDYMVPPPEEERIIKHGMMIDTEKSYEHYIDYQWN